MIGSSNGFLDQYERMIRFRERLNDFTGTQKRYEDDMWAFFQSAYHLKDWIKNEFDNHFKDDIEDYINEGCFIKIAADLANRSKHLKLTSIRGGDADINRNDIVVQVPLAELNLCPVEVTSILNKTTLETTHTMKYYVNITGGLDFECLDLADKIINEWDAYIKPKVGS